MSLLFAPGLLSSEPVRTAALVGGTAAIVSGVAGVLTVIRGQSFAGHALADVSSAGGAAALLLGVSPLLGFLAMGVAAAACMELVVVGRVRERDLVTGVVLGAGLGLSALLLYLDVVTRSGTGAASVIMFGSMFALPDQLVTPALAIGGSALVAVFLLLRPLLLCSVDPDLAAVRGVPVRLLGLVHLIVLALAVSLSAMTVGAILSTALLVGPAAIALRLAERPGSAILLAAGLGLLATLGGIVLAYDSYGWTPGHGWPVSFCIVLLICLMFAAGTTRRRSSPAG